MDRRSFIATAPVATVALAISARAGAAIAPRDAEWRRAVAAFDAATLESNKQIARLSEIEGEYFRRRSPLPRGGLTLFKDGQPFGLEEAVAKSRTEQEAWHREDQELRARLGVDAATAANEAASGLFGKRLNDLMECPAPDLSAVVVKLQLAEEYELGNAAILADIKRMTGEE